MKAKTKSKKYKAYAMENDSLNQKIRDLLRAAGPSPYDSLLQEMIVTALKIREDELDRGDIRLINTTMKEMRYAIKVFQAYRHVRKVAVFGSARTDPKMPDYKIAKEFAKQIVRAGWMVITGAASGIMRAGNEGAGRANSFGVNIRLPFEQDANPVIHGDPKLVNFKYFFTRKLIFVSESHATVLCPGGFGTHDEGFETLTLVQTGKATPRPIICLDPPGSQYWAGWKRFIEEQLVATRMVDPDDIHLMKFTHDPKEAVQMITDFYRNYHSMRYIGDKLVIRIKKALSKKRLLELNRKFGVICKKGNVVQQKDAFDEEANEPHTLDLVRLVFYFDRRHFSKLHHLVEFTNIT